VCFLGIPVIISLLDEPMSQFNWHYSSLDQERAFVVLPVVRHGKNPTGGHYMHILAKISDEEILERQQHIAKIAFKSQYSMPPDATSRDIPNTTAVLKPWTPPQPDAVDVTLEKLFERAIHYQMSLEPMA